MSAEGLTGVGLSPETETAEFKILNKLTGFRLTILSSTRCWIKEGVSLNCYTIVRVHKTLWPLHVIAAELFCNHYTDKRALHKCDIKACCNPTHLYSGTDRDNILDRYYRVENTIPLGVVINRSNDWKCKKIIPKKRITTKEIKIKSFKKELEKEIKRNSHYGEIFGSPEELLEAIKRFNLT